MVINGLVGENMKSLDESKTFVECGNFNQFITIAKPGKKVFLLIKKRTV